MVCKFNFILIALLIVTVYFQSAVANSNIKIDKLFAMSIEELMQVEVNEPDVDSTKSPCDKQIKKNKEENQKFIDKRSLIKPFQFSS